MLTIGSLFSGIGGLELGLERAGLGPVRWQVEIDERCRRVLSRHWPHAARFGDVRRLDAAALPAVDVVCGGFPCQPVSLAGKGLGSADERWLWPEFARIVAAVRPRYVVAENVPGLVRRGLAGVVADLAALGYSVEATRLSAEDLGAPHRRERLFLVAHAERLGVRNEPRRLGGSRRPREALSADDGLSGPLADADGQGQLQSSRLEREEWRRPRHGDGAIGAWPSGAGILRVAHGLPERVDRLRALGNAVVPACAEVVGWRVRQLEEARQGRAT